MSIDKKNTVANEINNGSNVSENLSKDNLFFKDNSKEYIKKLKELYLEKNRLKYPNLPESVRFAPNYTDQNTNGLTKCVIDFLKLNGFHCERTGNEGRVINNRRVHGTGTNGTSDIKAIINGKFIAIEIKCKATKDKQSIAQKEYQKAIELSGGIYLIVGTFGGFIDWYEKYLTV